jgi:hypothetical protein
MNDSVMVYTENSLVDCIERGGIAWWTIGARAVDKIKYVVVTQKGGIDDKVATFIAKVTGHIKHPDPRENRVMFTFQEYAEIHVPNAWPGNRNPVNYLEGGRLEKFLEDTGPWRKIGVGIAKGANRNPENLIEKLESLSIAQIKEVLARKYEVTPSAIEITVKA